MLLAIFTRLSRLFLAPISKLSTVSELNVAGALLIPKFWKSTPQAASGTGLLRAARAESFRVSEVVQIVRVVLVLQADLAA